MGRHLMHDGDSTPASPPLPNGWFPTILGATASLVVLVCGVFLTVQHLAARPMDLREATLSAANAIEAGLLSNRVPEPNIAASEEFRATEAAEFHYFEYDVTVPSVINPERLQGVLRRHLQQLGVSAGAIRGGRGEPMLELVLADQLFGYVRLSPQRDTGWHAWPTVDEGGEESPTEEHAAPAIGTPVISVPGAKDAMAREVPESVDLVQSAAEEPMEPSTDAATAQAIDSEEELATDAEISAVATVESGWSAPVRTASLPAVVPNRSNRPNGMRVAIIMDDGGYGGELRERVLALDPNLTLSILPYTPHAIDTANRAIELGFEVMLHMPMENFDPELVHEGQLEVGMSPATIGALTLRALDYVPGAVGVNNHMGSKFTSDKMSMQFFVDAIRDQSLYFVDSRTTANSCAYEVAYEAGLPVGYRNIFLDHENDVETIERQFDSMMTMAEENGSIIAIAHFRPDTVDVLERKLPELEAAGIDLVHASTLLP